MPSSDTPLAPTMCLGENETAYTKALQAWREADATRRLFAGDASLFTGADEDRWLGWQDAPALAQPHVATWHAWARKARSDGLRDVVLLGMGGSSLCPDVLRQTFPPAPGAPRLHVLDSTVPAEIRALTERIEPGTTLFVVASKSGSTIEPTVLMEHLYAVTREALGESNAGAHFMAITDPGSELEAHALREGFLHLAHGVPRIGGRFSALSAFGLVPAALLGLDLDPFLERAAAMRNACLPDRDDATNPGVSLGLALGALAREGRDKLTLVLSPDIRSLGTWIEQLVAESTGKNATGILPVEGEALGPPEAYGSDRAFAYLRLAEAPDALQDEGVLALEEAGFPVVRIALSERLDIAGEFYRWQVATAVAGSLLGVNPFDQPDVEAAKQAARQRLEPSASGSEATPTGLHLECDGMRLDADGGLLDAPSIAAALSRHFDRLRAGDYMAINAFVERHAAHEALLDRLRNAIRDSRRVATTVGFGPRFLHSTGQFHKGGPNSGVFLEITSIDQEPLAIAGRSFDFAMLNRAQAEGDFRVLCERGRRVVRVVLDPARGQDLAGFVQEALRSLEVPPGVQNTENA